MNKTFTYINYLGLSGNKLDTDFEKECKKQGATDKTKVDVLVLPAITGHTAYIVTLTNKKGE